MKGIWDLWSRLLVPSLPPLSASVSSKQRRQPVCFCPCFPLPDLYFSRAKEADANQGYLDEILGADWLKKGQSQRRRKTGCSVEKRALETSSPPFCFPLTLCTYLTDSYKTEKGNAFSLDEGEKKSISLEDLPMKKSLLVLSFVLCLLLFCPGNLVASPVPEGRIVIHASGDPLTLDPFFLSSDAYAWDLSHAINVYPFIIGPDGNYQVDALESFEMLDEKTLILTLRRDILFHDKTPLTLEDLLFTFEVNLCPDFGSLWHLSLQSVVESVLPYGEWSLQVNLKDPWMPLLKSFKFPIVPKEAYEAKGAEFARKPIGAGPFKLTTWVPNEILILEAFPEYFDGAPHIQTLEFRVMEYSCALEALLAEEIHVLGIDNKDAKDLEGISYLKVERKPGTSWYYLGVNQTEGPLAHKLVRQAISYSIDKEKIIREAFNGELLLATGPIVPLSFAYYGDVRRYPYNPKKAQLLLEKAGYPEGFTVTLKHRDTSLAASHMGYIVDQLAEIGITVELIPLTWADLTEDVHQKNFELHYRAWTRQMDPKQGVDSQFGSTTNSGIAGYTNPKLDALLHVASSTFDQAERISHYRVIQEILAEDLPAIFLWYGNHISAYNTLLQDYEMDPYYSYRAFRHAWLKD